MGVAVALAVEGDETQTGFSFHIARALDDVGPEAIADEAVARAVGMLGAAKPATAKVPVVLDQFAAMSFLGVLASALNAESVLKGRSLFADMVGQQVGSDLFTLVDDGTRARWAGRLPVRRRRRRQRAHRALHGGHVERVPARHVHGDPHGRAAQESTGNAKRGSYKGAPGVGTSNFYLDAGASSFEELLARAEGGVLIRDVSGVHSGANPISGEFSVGATGLRIAGRRAG